MTKNVKEVVDLVARALDVLKCKLAKAKQAAKLALEAGLDPEPAEQAVKDYTDQLAKLQAFASPTKAPYSKPSMVATTSPEAKAERTRKDKSNAWRRARRALLKKQAAKAERAERARKDRSNAWKRQWRAERKAAIAKAAKAKARTRAKARKAS